MKVEATYNNGKPWLTLRPENDLDKKLMADMLSMDTVIASGGHGYGPEGSYFNVTVKPWRKSLRKRIAMVFHPDKVRW